MSSSFFFFNDTATTEIYTLSLHDALPICRVRDHRRPQGPAGLERAAACVTSRSRTGLRFVDVRHHARFAGRSEEHTSELQSRQYLVCRLLLEKKKTVNTRVAVCYTTRLD